jgi:hypothetical protein
VTVIAPEFRPPPNATLYKKREWEEQMRAWLEWRLDQQNMEALRGADASWERICIDCAEHGDIAPLRQLYPHLAKFLYPPKLRPGEKYRKQRKFDPVKAAADYAQRIRALWREQYGLKNRRQGEKSAEGFAADICKELFEQDKARLTVHAVLAAAKPSGRHKPR